jgi:PST family polysaccharide transporter
VSGANLAGYASRNADNLLIGWYWGATALGFYSKAYDLLMAPLTQVAGPLGQALQPILGRLRDDPDRYRMVITHVLSASLLILLPVGTLMAWRSSDVTVLLLGEPWLPAAPIVGWFGLLVCFHLCGSILTWSLVTRQRGMDLSRTAVVNAFVNLVGFAVSLPYGVVAVAATNKQLGALVRTPYFLYVCSGDEFLPRASVLKALALPLVSFVSISLLYTALAATPTVIRLPGWQSLLFQLAMGYLLLTALVFPSSLGRFVLRRGQPPKS